MDENPVRAPIEHSLAVLAYNAYGAVTDHKNYQGLPMPAYEDLTDKIKEAWQAAVMAVRQQVLWDEETSN